MVHPSHDAAAGPQLDGYIPLGPPSDVITLYEGPLQLRVGDDLARQRPGEITLVLRSGSHLVWGVDLDGASYEERLQWQFREGSGVPMLRFAFHGTPLELETYLTGDGYGFFGHRTSNADDKTELASVVSHWVNLPHLPHGSRLCHEHDDGSWVEWGGRWMLTLGDWDVTVDERRDLGETLRTATRERLYAISHVRAIHLSGGVLVSGSPRSVRRRALQAGRIPAAQRSRERRRRWPLGGDEFAVADRFVIDGELE